MVLPRWTVAPGTRLANASISGSVRLRAPVTSLPTVVTPAGSGVESDATTAEP